jgi:S-adenosylmethionine:tRNA ribosyltransferase-isomerase
MGYSIKNYSQILYLQKKGMLPKDIRIEDYNYELPDERIAKYPMNERDGSKLLLYDKGIISGHVFSSIPSFFDVDDFLVFNDTKVIQARMLFQKDTGARIEIFLLEPIVPNDYVRVFQRNDSCKWKCIVGNLKKWKAGNVYADIDAGHSTIRLTAEKDVVEKDAIIVNFKWENTGITFGEILDRAGQTPIPPYLNRNFEEIDKLRYQTVYSKYEGSVAAPTAGLHFTETVLNGFADKGIETATITLHVGAGTFKPVKSDSVFDHEMHTEHFVVDKALIERLVSDRKTLTAVGTTTVRTLESLYWLGNRLKNNPNENVFHVSQWEPYETDQTCTPEEAFRMLLDYFEKNGIGQLNASTAIMIVPGYRFRVVDKMITNFHQPKSTLLLLIAAFIGLDWSDVYRYALDHDYRFLSYGDSSLLIPA